MTFDDLVLVSAYTMSFYHSSSVSYVKFPYLYLYLSVSILIWGHDCIVLSKYYGLQATRT
jgi:hypothetical protein